MESRKEYFTLERQGPKPGCCDRRGACCACLLFLGILLLITGAVTLLIFLIMLSAEPGPVTETPCGPVHGMYYARAKAFVYKGIPYAKPPVGDLRWRPSEELKGEEAEEEGGEAGKCWEGTLEARSDPDMCVSHSGTPNSNSSSVSGHEDCLYLNIYVPDLKYKDKKTEEPAEEEEEAPKNGHNGTTTTMTPSAEPAPEPSAEPTGGKNESLPVVVFIHGEHVGEQYMPPIRLAEELEVILVVPQFRMGALGYMVLEDFESDQVGNYGFGDVIQALKWVKHNIKAFGGDPDKVTIVGSGMGGTIVWGLLTSAESRDLFSRAWVMSGSTNIRTEMAEAAEANKYMWDNSGCDKNATCLREMSAEDVTKIYEAGRAASPFTGLPTVDEKDGAQMVIFGPLHNPLEEFHKSGTGISQVPIVVGSAAQSIDYNPAPGEALKNWDEEMLLTHLDEHFQDFDTDVAKNALDLYNMTKKDAEFKYTSITSDIRYVCQQDQMAEAASRHITEPVYRYVMRTGPSSGARVYGSDFTANYAFQGWDTLALFGKLCDVLEGGATDKDENLRKTLLENLANFAKEGKLIAPWKEFPGSTALLSNDITFTSRRYNKDMCDYWADKGLLAYGATH